MPACARKEIIIEGEVGAYHVWTRCVRRSFLCGQDETTGRNYDHRRDWIRQYLPRLCGLFGVEAGFHVEMATQSISEQDMLVDAPLRIRGFLAAFSA